MPRSRRATGVHRRRRRLALRAPFCVPRQAGPAERRLDRHSRAPGNQIVLRSPPPHDCSPPRRAPACFPCGRGSAAARDARWTAAPPPARARCRRRRARALAQRCSDAFHASSMRAHAPPHARVVVGRPAVALLAAAARDCGAPRARMSCAATRSARNAASPPCSPRRARAPRCAVRVCVCGGIMCAAAACVAARRACGAPPQLGERLAPSRWRRPARPPPPAAPPRCAARTPPRARAVLARRAHLGEPRAEAVGDSLLDTTPRAKRASRGERRVGVLRELAWDDLAVEHRETRLVARDGLEEAVLRPLEGRWSVTEAVVGCQNCVIRSRARKHRSRQARLAHSKLAQP